MSTTHYAPSRSAASSERYVRGLADERGVAVTCDVPGGPGEFSRRAEALAAANDREVEALHYRQSFDAAEFDPDSAEDVQRVNDLGYQLGKRMHPHADALVVTHTDGRGRKPHNHILITNHDNETGRALSDYRTFKDRPDQGQQRGVQSVNDELMTEHGLTIARERKLAAKDWDMRREEFAEGSLSQQMGDRFEVALLDKRSVDVEGLREVIAEQNDQADEYGDRVPRMRLHSTTAKKGKNAGKERWTLYIEDDRDEAKRAELRHAVTRLSPEFAPDQAQAMFEHNRKRMERDHGIDGQGQGRRRAGAQFGDAGDVGLEARRRRAAAHDTDEGREGAHRASEDHGRGADEADRPGSDLAALREHVAADRGRREQAERDREHAQRVREESRREEAERRLAEFGRRGAEESRGYGLGD